MGRRDPAGAAAEVTVTVPGPPPAVVAGPNNLSQPERVTPGPRGRVRVIFELNLSTVENNN